MRDLAGTAMRINYGDELTLQCPASVPVVCMMDVHPDRRADVEVEEPISTRPFAEMETYSDLFGNICRRFVAPAGETLIRSNGFIRDSGLIDDADPEAREVPFEELPAEALPFLAGSRYCETDVIGEFAWNTFGHLKPGYSRVQAIVDHGKANVTFDYQRACSTRTATQTLAEGVGVCRDFAHLAIACCRALNIPARYVNGYLGDIGIPRQPYPMDFSAWMEVWLGDRWYTFDPRNNARRIGRIVIARGRDAADVPMVATFGPHYLTSFKVWTDEV
jgi:transglutaminase-like putative cysteine protease